MKKQKPKVAWSSQVPTAKYLEFELIIEKTGQDGGSEDSQSVSSLGGKLRELVEKRIARDKTHIKSIVDYDLKKWGNKVVHFEYLPPDTVRLILQHPITKAQRDYLGCEVVDPDGVGPDTWMEGDLDIIIPGESSSYPCGAELLVILKDEQGNAYDCTKPRGEA